MFTLLLIFVSPLSSCDETNTLLKISIPEEFQGHWETRKGEVLTIEKTNFVLKDSRHKFSLKKSLDPKYVVQKQTAYGLEFYSTDSSIRYILSWVNKEQKDYFIFSIRKNKSRVFTALFKKRK
jgi:hypothetical protein